MNAIFSAGIKDNNPPPPHTHTSIADFILFVLNWAEGGGMFVKKIVSILVSVVLPKQPFWLLPLFCSWLNLIKIRSFDPLLIDQSYFNKIVHDYACS